ncbi:MAG: hypothetical protein ABR927_16315 [Bacteroidales bacterium]|jgi:tetratricopeptide (TPR) repeat protein
MASIIPGYEYDIFISYRQKDNKGDRWVSEFVDALKTELESTFKEEISVYFDINPHDGLLETHDVDASLKEKLKCLIFIPIISRTYCDPKSFAWQHEFETFVEQAKKDQFGLKVKLPSGNIANRVLPVRIHDLDNDDIKLCESVLSGYLRGVEFIYREPGVNKPLTSEDDEKKNLNNTKYKIQINKTANAIKEIIAGMTTGEMVSGKEKAADQISWEETRKEKRPALQLKSLGTKKRKRFSIIISVLIIAVLAGIFVYPKVFKRDTMERLRSSGERIAIAVLPFQNLTNDTTWNIWQDVIQESLISSLSNTGELKVKQKEPIRYLLQTKGLIEHASISPAVAGTISKTLDADIFIFGNMQKAGPVMRLNAQLIDTKTRDVLKSFEINGPYKEEKISDIIDSLRKKVTDFLTISRLMKEFPSYFQLYTYAFKSPEVLRYIIFADNAKARMDYSTARKWYLKALDIDSSSFDAYLGLWQTAGTMEQSLQALFKLYNKREQMPALDQMWVSWAYALSFEPGEVIKCLRQIQEIDDQNPNIPFLTGNVYNSMNQYDKAIPLYEKNIEMAQKLGVENNYGYAALGETYHKTGQYKEEKKIYNKAEQCIPDHSSILYSWIIRDCAALSLTKGDSVNSNKYIENYKSVMKGNLSSETEITEGLALIYKSAGVLDKAEEYYRKALSMEPGNAGLINRFANFLIENNRKFNEVSLLTNKAMELAQNRVDYFNYSDTKGWGLYKQGSYQEALEVLQKTLDEAPYKLYSIKSHLEEVKKAIADNK